MVIFIPMETLVGWVNSPTWARRGMYFRGLAPVGSRKTACCGALAKMGKNRIHPRGRSIGLEGLQEAGAGGLAGACLSRHLPGAQLLFGFDEEGFSMQVLLAVPFVVSKA